MRPLLQPELYLNATLRPSSPLWLIPLRASVFPISQILSAPGGDQGPRQVKESAMVDWQSKDSIIFKQVIRSLSATEGLQEVNLQEGEVP
jgi:hypothetical protein